MNKPTTIHTSRTLMFKEFSRIMDFAIEDDSYLASLTSNVINKQSKSNENKTIGYLKTLYSFNLDDDGFKSLKYFWSLAEPEDRPLLTMVFAVGRDYLLSESIDIVHHIQPGTKVPIELFETNIERYHPNRFSFNTKHSVAQNIASSWKQAGFIVGKVKNIRVQPRISHIIGAYAFLRAYLLGDRGDYIWSNPAVKALCLPDAGLRDLAINANKRDLLLYQYAGSVTVLSFTNILNKIGIDAN